MPRWLLTSILGLLAGILATAISHPFIGGISGHTIHPNYTLGSFYGWFAHFTLGALISGSISAVFGYDQSGVRGLFKCVSVGFLLGGILVAAADASFDYMLIKTVGDSLPFIGGFLWSLMVSFALATAIAVATGLTRERLSRAFAAGLAGTFLTLTAREFVSTFIVMHLASSATKVGSADHWQANAGLFAAEYITLGVVMGTVFGMVETMMKPVVVRQLLGRNEWREWPLIPPVATIGSDESNQVRIASLLPFHAQLQAQGTAWFITDQGGNLRVNGQPATQAWLRDGDQIWIDGVVLSYGNGLPQPVDYARTSTSAPASAGRIIDPFGGITQLIPGRATIGRDPGADIALTWDVKASRAHAEIETLGQTATIRDLGSTNGTVVGGQKLSGPHTLRDGDLIEIGTTRLTFRA